MMFACGQPDGPVEWFGPVNHPDMLVGIGDAMDIEKPGSDERTGAGPGRRRPFPNELDLQTALLPGFAQRGLLRVFVQFDVPSQRQPLVEFVVVHHQDFSPVHYKDGDGEINFVVNMSHTKFLTVVISAARLFKSVRPRIPLIARIRTERGRSAAPGQDSCEFVKFVGSSVFVKFVGGSDTA